MPTDDDDDAKRQQQLHQQQQQQLHQQQQQQLHQQQQQQQGSSQWIPPTTGNPDLDPAGLQQQQRIDLRETNPLVPQGMLYDPRQLLDQQRRQSQDRASGGGGGVYLPPGARFDPFGPPDPDQVGPGRPPMPSMQFGVPDPDHLPPPGQPQPPPNLGQAGKNLMFPFGPGRKNLGGGQFPPPGGSGGSPFL